MGHGTQKVRYGKDSQTPFGHCCLTLQANTDPVVSPSGHIYSKAMICKYLLTKVKELKRLKHAYEAQQADLEAKGALKDVEAAGAAKQKFMLLQDRVCDTIALAAPTRESVFSSSKRDKEARENRKRTIHQLTSKVDLESIADKKKRLSQTNFWLPDFTPGAAASMLKKPPKRPGSPMTGAPLRMKYLTPITLSRDPTDSSQIICPVSRKRITSQKCVLIKSTGHVLLESVFKKLTKGSGAASSGSIGPVIMQCPVTGERITDDDLLPLVASGSSFAAGGTVEAKSWRPMI